MLLTAVKLILTWPRQSYQTGVDQFNSLTNVDNGVQRDFAMTCCGTYNLNLLVGNPECDFGAANILKAVMLSTTWVKDSNRCALRGPYIVFDL